MRGLAMDFEGDRRAWGVDDQYMFGPALMAAPVTAFHARSRDVYLPAGALWYDFRTGRAEQGGRTIRADAPYEWMPLFVRAGSIVPTGPAVQNTSEHGDGSLTLHVFTGANGAFSLYEDDGVSRQYLHGAFARVPIAWNEATRTLTIGARQGRYPGMAARRTIRVIWYDPGHPARLAFDGPADQSVTYAGARIKAAAGDEEAGDRAKSRHPVSRQAARRRHPHLWRRRPVPADRIYPLGLGRPASRRGAADAIDLGPRRAQPRRHARLRARLHALLDARQPRRGPAGRRGRAGRDLGRGARTAGRRAAIAKDEVAALLDHALIVPVLTAHPTEVRRKCIIDHRNRIAELMRAARRRRGRDRGRRSESSWRSRARSPCSGRPAPLRRERLYVADEVETALSYLRDVFLPVLPALYARWERALGQRPPSFLRLGSWIGGDRDGNPFVDAAALELALGSAREAVLGYYLDEVHALGAELSISSELAAVPADVARAGRPLAATQRRARADEPYRRALSGIYAPPRRHLSWRFTGERAAAAADASTASPMPAPTSSAPSCDGRARRRGLARSLATGGPLGRLIRAVETFGFHLATLDLRQNADVHERVVAELLKVAGRRARLSRAERGRRASPCSGASSPARACSPARSPTIRTRPGPSSPSSAPPPRRGRATGRARSPLI